MMQSVVPKSSERSGQGWRSFGANVPAPDETVEIRRAHDDKTILRRRADLSPSFDLRHAQWRPI